MQKLKQKTRIAAIIIKNNKLLLVKGADKYKEYWTPGGTLEDGETDLECLKRELDEELNVKLVSSKFFREYLSPSAYHKDCIITNKVFIVNISGEPKGGKEIQGYVWMSKEDFNNNIYPLIEGDHKKIIPDLIKEGIF